MSIPDSHGWMIPASPPPATSRTSVRYRCCATSRGYIRSANAVAACRSEACSTMSSTARACSGGCVMPDVATSGGLSSATELRQNPGPGKYASSGTSGLNTMWGTMPLDHCPVNRCSSSCCARCWSIHDRPVAMNAVSQFHWWGYSWPDGTVWSPRQLPSRTAAAPSSSAVRSCVLSPMAAVPVAAAASATMACHPMPPDVLTWSTTASYAQVGLRRDPRVDRHGGFQNRSARSRAVPADPRGRPPPAPRCPSGERACTAPGSVTGFTSIRRQAARRRRGRWRRAGGVRGRPVARTPAPPGARGPRRRDGRRRR